MESGMILKLIILLSLAGGIRCKRIMLLPVASTSHVLYFEALGEALHGIYGYDVYMVLPETYPGNSKLSKKMHLLNYSVLEDDLYSAKMDAKTREDMFMECIGNATTVNLFGRNVPLVLKLAIPWCAGINSDQALFKTLSDLKMDFAIFDFIWPGVCHTILPYRLGVPYASFGTMLDTWLTRNPHLPSFVPFRLGTIYSEKMNFWERLSNMVSRVHWSSIELDKSPYFDDSLVTKFAPDMPSITLKELFGRSLLTLVNSNPLLEGAKPFLPNVIEVGGLMTKPGKQLPSDFEKAMTEAKLGTIVVSFGALTSMLPLHLMQKIADALNNFPEYNIFWKYVGKTPPANLNSNIKLLSWIPQNDLLADNRTMLFVTHCGNNGQFEAFYHGVPMIGLPLYVDQLPNAARAQYKNFGLCMNIMTVTVEELTKGIHVVLSNPKYKNNIQKAAKIFRSQPHPRQKAAYWVNHVIKFGGSHLHSHAIYMPWYEYLMLDILLFVISLFAFPVAAVFVLIKKNI